jgi:hypothetical protein
MIPHIIKQKLAEPIKGDALHEAGRDDAVSIDIGTRHITAGAGNSSDFREGHDKGDDGVLLNPKTKSSPRKEGFAGSAAGRHEGGPL